MHRESFDFRHRLLFGNDGMFGSFTTPKKYLATALKCGPVTVRVSENK